MLALLFGFLAGTLAEYLIHRTIGHGPQAADSRANLLARHGTLHHKVFTERRGVAARRGEARGEHVHLQLRAVFIALAIILVAGAAMLPVFGPMHAGMAVAGLVLTIIVYDVLHWMHHRDLPGWVARLPLYSQARTWHHKHHLEPDSRYSILLPIWDFLFFTHHGLPEASGAEASRDLPLSEPATRQKRTPTSIKDMLRETMDNAEAQLDGPAPKTRRRRRDTDVPSRRTAAATRRTGGAKRGGPKSRPSSSAKNKPADWMAALDRAMEEDLDIKVTAVKVDDD